jgi:hypothetical protein
MNKTILNIETVILNMLKENTGRHFLDSGGAYGRSWERNQSRDIANEPPCKVEYHDEAVEISYSLYHFLISHLEYDEECDKLTVGFLALSNTPEYEDKAWHDIMEGWIEANGFEFTGADNSYNHDTLLDQDIAYRLFNSDTASYIFLQIHGGCDIRGGYTAPKVFRLPDEDYFWMHMRECYAYCKGCGAAWDSDNAGYEWRVGQGGIPTHDPRQLELQNLPEPQAVEVAFSEVTITDEGATCPICGGKVEFDVYTSW